MRSLEDIDEDEPAPIVIGLPPNSVKSANTGSANDTGSVMDDLFGPSTSVASPVVTSSNSNSSSNPQKNSQSQQSGSPAVKSDALDDFFGPSNNPNNIQKNNGNKNSGTSAPNGSSYINNNNANSNKAPDVFDSLFSSAPPSSNTNNNWFGGNSNNFGGSATTTTTTTMGPSSASATSGTARSAIDQLDAFSAFSRGAAVPWKQTTSVADAQTKVLDIFGDGSGGGDGADEGRGGVFIPPDQVLSLMTLYDVVGAAPSWQVEDISKAYKKKAILLHPDKLPGGKRTEREDRYFKIITAAYDVLKDKDKRADYDAALRHGGGSQGSWLNFVS